MSNWDSFLWSYVYNTSASDEVPSPVPDLSSVVNSDYEINITPSDSIDENNENNDNSDNSVNTSSKYSYNDISSTKATYRSIKGEGQKNAHLNTRFSTFYGLQQLPVLQPSQQLKEEKEEEEDNNDDNNDYNNNNNNNNNNNENDENDENNSNDDDDNNNTNSSSNEDEEEEEEDEDENEIGNTASMNSGNNNSNSSRVSITIHRHHIIGEDGQRIVRRAITLQPREGLRVEIPEENIEEYHRELNAILHQNPNDERSQDSNSNNNNNN
ncbi:uncharacterized protein TM35_000262240, partial [Trypanosoma theileri]